MKIEPTHFYILDSDGNKTNDLGNVTGGDGLNLTLGLVNYEHQLMNYTVLSFLSNHSFNATKVIEFNDLYYLGNISYPSWNNVSHVNVAKGALWAPQLEDNYTLTVNDPLEGRATLWFILYKNEVPPSLATSTNLSGDLVARNIIERAIAGEFQYRALTLHLIA